MTQRLYLWTGLESLQLGSIDIIIVIRSNTCPKMAVAKVATSLALVDEGSTLSKLAVIDVSPVQLEACVMGAMKLEPFGVGG